MEQPVWDLTKIPKKYNRKAKLHGKVKNIKNLNGWEKIIQEMRQGKKSPTDPYIEEILHECIEVLREVRNPDVRRLTGIAKDLLLFADLGEVLVSSYGWEVKIAGMLDLCRLIDVDEDPNLSRRYETYGEKDLLASASEDEMLNVVELFAVYNPVLKNFFVPWDKSCKKWMMCSVASNNTNDV